MAKNIQSIWSTWKLYSSLQFLFKDNYWPTNVKQNNITTKECSCPKCLPRRCDFIQWSTWTNSQWTNLIFPGQRGTVLPLLVWPYNNFTISLMQLLQPWPSLQPWYKLDFPKLNAMISHLWNGNGPLGGVGGESWKALWCQSLRSNVEGLGYSHSGVSPIRDAVEGSVKNSRPVQLMPGDGTSLSQNPFTR